MELEIRCHIQNDPAPNFLEVVFTHAQWRRCPLLLVNNWVWLGGTRKCSTFVYGGKSMDRGFSYCSAKIQGWTKKKNLCRNQRALGNNFFHQVIQPNYNNKDIITIYIHHEIIMEEILHDTYPWQSYVHHCYCNYYCLLLCALRFDKGSSSILKVVHVSTLLPRQFPLQFLVNELITRRAWVLLTNSFNVWVVMNTTTSLLMAAKKLF